MDGENQDSLGMALIMLSVTSRQQLHMMVSRMREVGWQEERISEFLDTHAVTDIASLMASARTPA